MESASESDSELSCTKSVNHKKPSVSAQREPGSGIGTTPEEMDSDKVTGVGSKRYNEMTNELKELKELNEALSSKETSNIFKEAGSASAQEEDSERRFVLHNRIPDDIEL